MLDQLARLLAPLQRRISNMIARGVVSKVDDAQDVQGMQLDLLTDETRDGIERFQNYGFTSKPMEGAEAVVVFVDGRRDNGLVIAVDDRRYRVVSLEDGEVAIYDSTGSVVKLKANGDISLTPSSGTVAVTGDITVSGTLTATTDVVGGGKSLKNHTHIMTPAQSPLAVAGAVGTISGTSGAPS